MRADQTSERMLGTAKRQILANLMFPIYQLGMSRASARGDEGKVADDVREREGEGGEAGRVEDGEMEEEMSKLDTDSPLVHPDDGREVCPVPVLEGNCEHPQGSQS